MTRVVGVGKRMGGNWEGTVQVQWEKYLSKGFITFVTFFQTINFLKLIHYYIKLLHYLFIFFIFMKFGACRNSNCQSLGEFVKFCYLVRPTDERLVSLICRQDLDRQFPNSHLSYTSHSQTALDFGNNVMISALAVREPGPLQCEAIE